MCEAAVHSVGRASARRVRPTEKSPWRAGRVVWHPRTDAGGGEEGGLIMNGINERHCGGLGVLRFDRR